MSDQLENLLRNAESSLPQPQLTDNLAARCRRQAMYHQCVTRWSLAAAGIAIVIGLSIAWSSNQPQNKAIVPIDAVASIDVAIPDEPQIDSAQEPSQEIQNRQRIAQLESEVMQLRYELNYRMQIVEDMLTSRQQEAQLARLNSQLDKQLEPMIENRLEYQRTAWIMYRQADYKYRELGLTTEAARDYQRVIQNYPETHGAQEAGKMLEQIKLEKQI